MDVGGCWWMWVTRVKLFHLLEHRMDVVVVGSCNTDLLSRVPRLPKPGETLHGHTFKIGFGGKGANQCVMAGRMDAKTAMVAKVGDDIFGHNTIENFKENNVSTANIGITKEASTGVAPIAVDDSGQNSIVIVSGANLLLSEQDVIEAETVIQGCKVLLCQLEISTNTTLAALKLAKKHNVTTILNPAPAQTDLSSEMFQYTDILCPNETEAELLSGEKVETVEDAHKVLPVLLSRGCGTVIITMGEKGAVFATREQPTPVHVTAPNVKASDTTGAGDAFVGSLAYYLSQEKLDLKECVSRAVQIASISVQALGTQTSYPLRENIPTHLLL